MHFPIIISADIAMLAHGFVSTDPNRPHLAGIYIAPRRDGSVTVVATDGMRMGVFRDTQGQADHASVITLPKDALAAIKKLKGVTAWLVLGDALGRSRTAFVIGHKTRVMTPDEAREIAQNYEKSPIGILWRGFVSEYDGAYPAWERVIPAGPYVASSALIDASLLTPFIAVAATREGGARSTPWTRLLSSDGTAVGPLLVQTCREDFVGILMPACAKSVDMQMPANGFVSLPGWLADNPAKSDAA